ncbi:MAG: hypothetical protein QOE14_41 [Humisphaera sp.]|nr:hypothetical protein [Humisphaera sp.]
MNISEFISQMEERRPPASETDLVAFEAGIGCRLPEDYRQFLRSANGGSVNDDRFTHSGSGLYVCSVGGIAELVDNRECYQISERRIPDELLWIADTDSSAAFCIGLTGGQRGTIYFWDNGNEPGSRWDGRFESAGNITLLANSFTEFIDGLETPKRAEKRFGRMFSVTAITAIALFVFYWITK